MDSSKTVGCLIAKLTDDPWSLSDQERDELLRAMPKAQREWLGRIGSLVEPPTPDAYFPAFLLALPPFARLAEKLLGPRPDTGARDELQRFVDRYRDWLGHDRLATRQSGQSASNARS